MKHVRGPTLAPPLVAGFNLLELTVVMVVLSIMAMAVWPKLPASAALRTQAWHDQSLAALRLARSMASSHRRVVCVLFTGNAVRLQMALTQPATSCAAAVKGPSGQATFASLSEGGVVTSLSLSGASYTGELYFQPEGRITTDLAGDAPGQWVLRITGAEDIEIDGVSGHAL